ncbi:MAG: hypothetical protein AB4041_03265 [Microcystaceae cyanobacterium]
MLSLQEILSSVDQLSVDDKEYLFKVLKERLIEDQEVEILASAEELMEDFKEGRAKIGTVDDLIADLLGDENESCLE